MSIQEAKQQYETAQSNYIKAFWTELKQIFDNYPEFESASFRLNNNEWNDGEASVFSIYYEEGVDYTYGGVDREDFCFYGLKDEPEDINEKPVYLLCKALSLSHPIHEEMFSDEYESMDITRDMVGERFKEISKKDTEPQD